MADSIEESDFWKFIEEFVPHDSIVKMRDEKVGPDIISVMSDNELGNYIPCHGDRIRVKAHVQGRETSMKKKTKKNSLVTLLKEKLDKRRLKVVEKDTDDSDMRVMRKQFGNKNAEKTTRKIKLGWIHKDESDRMLHIREKKGGGTRMIDVNKGATKQDVIKESQKLFFPNGTSTKGDLIDYDCDLLDFSQRVVEDDKTISEIYNEMKLPILRFYLLTCDKNPPSQDSDDSLPQVLAPAPRENAEYAIGLDVALNDLPDIPQVSVPQNTFMSSGDVVRDAMTAAGIPEDLMAFGPTLVMDTETVETLELIHVAEHNVRLHRGHLLSELIHEFKAIDPEKDIVNLQVVMPNGQTEAAEDGGGVTRDVLCEFWSAFYDECTVGNTSKVPCIRHDYREEEWKSVAKIIHFGWKVVGYFPVQISTVFIEQCCFNQIITDLADAFLMYIPECDRKTIQAALTNITSVDFEELLDVLDQHQVKTVPTQDSVGRIVSEIAHKELVQSSMFVIDCWRPVLQNMRITFEELNSAYEKLQPTPRRVLQFLKFPDSISIEEAVVSNHLKRFVRELDEALVKKFLRFCTGSDLLICKQISVAFVAVSGLARRPVAHTCSCLLELPKSYDTFPQFRTEFLNILNANVWVMDII